MEIEELDDPIELFRRWYADAEAGEPRNANAMSLASLGPDGLPSIRTVLMKDVDGRGFVFYTNLESQKGVELRARPVAAICFYWRSIGRQNLCSAADWDRLGNSLRHRCRHNRRR